MRSRAFELPGVVEPAFAFDVLVVFGPLVVFEAEALFEAEELFGAVAEGPFVGVGERLGRFELPT